MVTFYEPFLYQSIGYGVSACLIVCTLPSVVRQRRRRKTVAYSYLVVAFLLCLAQNAAGVIANMYDYFSDDPERIIAWVPSQIILPLALFMITRVMLERLSVLAIRKDLIRLFHILNYLIRLASFALPIIRFFTRKEYTGSPITYVAPVELMYAVIIPMDSLLLVLCQTITNVLILRTLHKTSKNLRQNFATGINTIADEEKNDQIRRNLFLLLIGFSTYAFVSIGCFLIRYTGPPFLNLFWPITIGMFVVIEYLYLKYVGDMV